MSWRLASSPLVLDDRFPLDAPRTSIRSTGSRAHNVNQPWGALIDSDDFVLDFDDPAYVLGNLNPTLPCGFEIITLEGTIDPHSGTPWLAGIACYVEVVDNVVAQSGPGWDPDGADDDPGTEGVLDGDPDQHGEVGGPDPLGVHGKFLAAAAGTHAHAPSPGLGSRLQGWLSHKFYAPRASEPVVTIVDIYADREDSATWFAPLSEVEGNVFVVSSYWFGYTFESLSVLADDDHVMRRPLIVGPAQSDPPLGSFYVHPKSSPWRLKTDEWFSIAVRQTVDSFSVWVRDSQTIGVNGWEQNSLFDGVTGASDPGDTMGAFAGEIFESDWLQLIPGVEDDPGTAVIEGYGVAANKDTLTHPSFIDLSGSVAVPRASYPGYPNGIDAFHWRGGFDPTPTNLPTYTPNDVYIDNYVVLGTPVDDLACRADFDGDGDVDGGDLGFLLGGWGLWGVTNLDNTNATDGADLGLLLGAWGPCP
ncbi:MAG: hypothetical protein ACF8GE_11995 [Phycisphaerales bacterium JB043]